VLEELSALGGRDRGRSRPVGADRRAGDREGGRSVVVLEARDHVGGRMVRVPVVEGGWVDLGGQWIGPTQGPIAAVANQLSVKTFPWYHEGKTVLNFNAKQGFVKGEDAPWPGAPPTW